MTKKPQEVKKKRFVSDAVRELADVTKVNLDKIASAVSRSSATIVALTSVLEKTNKEIAKVSKEIKELKTSIKANEVNTTNELIGDAALQDEV